MPHGFATDEEDRTITIDIAHHEVHEGEMMYAEHVNASVSNGANLDLLITTGALNDHIVLNAGVGGQALLYLYEAPNATGGTTVTVYNMNRNSDKTALTTVTHTPTVTSTGTAAIINGRLLAGGTSPTTRVGGGIRSGTEFILKPNTKYLLRINNSSGGAIAINAALEWYEHD